MEKPMIRIDGKPYVPEEPKMKLWRKFLRFFDKDKTHLTIEEFLDEQIGLIVLAFDRPEVTADAVEANLGISEVVPMTRDLFRWIQSLTFEKLAKLPNEEAEKDEA